MTKKILFVVNVDWFFISHRLPIALEAIEKGYNVYLACGITDKKEYLQSLGINVVSINLSRSGTSASNETQTFISIYKILKKITPDIVHFVTIKPVIYGGIASRFLSIRKRIFSISGLGFIFINNGVRASCRRFLIKLLYRWSLSGNNTHVIVQNLDDETVVSNIINVPISRIKGSGVSVRNMLFKQEISTRVIVSMASRLLKDKGVFEYVAAAKILEEKGVDAEFRLYGDIDTGNPSTLTIEDVERIKNEGIVKVFGFSNDISTVFSNSNIVVLPSYREGFPKVLIEAAACGRAIVTTDVPGCRDAIIPGLTGLLCTPQDAMSLATQLEKLILDSELRKKMGKEARKLAEREFDIKNVVQKHFEIYEGC